MTQEAEVLDDILTVTVLTGPHAETRAWEVARQEHGPGYEIGQIVHSTFNEVTFELVKEDRNGDE